MIFLNLVINFESEYGKISLFTSRSLRDVNFGSAPSSSKDRGIVLSGLLIVTCVRFVSFEETNSVSCGSMFNLVRLVKSVSSDK